VDKYRQGMQGGKTQKYQHAPKIQIVIDPQSTIMPFTNQSSKAPNQQQGIPKPPSQSSSFGKWMSNSSASKVGARQEPSTVKQQQHQSHPLLPLNLKLHSANNHSSAKQDLGSKPTIDATSYQYTGKVDDIDVRVANDPLFVTDYVEDMYAHFRQKEGLTVVLPVYMNELQTHINEKMRAILVDWLVEVHMKFKLSPETLFLTVNLIDRYLERSEVVRSQLQLLGVSCLMIASKYEEIWPPSVQELVYICDNAYPRKQIIKMETQVLVALKYQITQPSAHTFLVRFLNAGHADKEMSQLAYYLLDGTLLSYSMLEYTPSQLAAAAVFLARHATQRYPWSPTLLKYSGYLEEDIKPIAHALLEEKSSASPDLQAVDKKYSSTRYGHVAKKPLTSDF
jgi:G2/mitotic-specific cyclin-B, other